MPEHYAIGVNIQKGTIQFNGTKTGEVIFPVPFDRKPHVIYTLENTGSPTVPALLAPTSGGWKVGFKLRFQTPHTGAVSWTAMK